MSQIADSSTKTGRPLDTLSESEYHRLHTAARRRIVLDVIDDQRCPIALDDLARSVGEHPDAAPAPSLTEVRTTLHHTHLPFMDSIGVLSYDPDSTRVLAASW
mgnify:CR=1 FL=1